MTQLEQGNWRVVGASVKGSSHDERGQPCQDAHRWWILPNGLLVAAVADGAGSASLGEVGAQIAADAALKSIADDDDGCWGLKGSTEGTANGSFNGDDEAIRQQLTRTLEAARKAVFAEAGKRGVNDRDLATTLIILVALKGAVAVAQVGDGAAAIGDDAGNILGVTTPVNGEYINETVFVTSPEALETAQINIWRGNLTHGAIFSDGLQGLCLKSLDGTPHPPFFGPLFDFVDEVPVSTSKSVGDWREAGDELNSFLNSPRVKSNTTDDLTLLLFAPT